MDTLQPRRPNINYPSHKIEVFRILPSQEPPSPPKSPQIIEPNPFDSHRADLTLQDNDFDFEIWGESTSKKLVCGHKIQPTQESQNASKNYFKSDTNTLSDDGSLTAEQKRDLFKRSDKNPKEI